MSQRYFKQYSDREVDIVNHWVKINPWLPNGTVYERANTPLHDGYLRLPNGCVCIVEVKVDEVYWFEKTGNIVLDYISAFNFISPEKKSFFCHQEKRWVRPQLHQHFLDSIRVGKWGKLITCDAHLQIFHVDGHYTRCYSNAALKSEAFLNYLKANHRVRINDKAAYGLSDDWESAAFIIPADDAELKKYEIADLETLMRVCECDEVGSILRLYKV